MLMMPSTTSPSSTTPRLVFSPAAERWGGLLGARWEETSAASVSENAFSPMRFRAQLGLPIDRPIVMSGHQAAIWHPGILAKYFAASALCRAIDAAPVWLVVDQDVNNWRSLRLPVRAAESDGGRLTSHVWEWAQVPDSDAPTGRMPAVRAIAPLPVGVTPAAGSVLPGLRAIHGALSEIASSSVPTHSSVASQLGAAVTELAKPYVPGPSPMVIMATSLARTDFMRALVERMIDDPAAAVLAYNRAVAANADAGVAPLAIDRDAEEYELPLWRLRPQDSTRATSARERVFSSALADIPLDELAPRALLMTAMLRMAGCDLFIHGTGGGATADDHDSTPSRTHDIGHIVAGGGYDRITEAWIAEWLGVSMAPAVMATATLTLDIDTPAVTDAEAYHAAWLAHHARHDPALLGDSAAAARKQELLAVIGAAKDAGDRRAAADAFAELQRLLRAAREAGHGVIVDLDRRAEEARQATHDADVVFDRTWPFPLYADAQLAALSDEIARAFSEQSA